MGTYRSRIRAGRHARHVGRAVAGAGVVGGIALAVASPTAAETSEAVVEPAPAASVAAEPPRDEPMPRTDGDVTPLAVAIVGLAAYTAVDLAPRPRRQRRPSS